MRKLEYLLEHTVPDVRPCQSHSGGHRNDNLRPRVHTSKTTCSNTQFDAQNDAALNADCTALKVCTSSEYESEPATTTTDRTCAALTVCDSAKGKTEVTAPTATANRECGTNTGTTVSAAPTQAPTKGTFALYDIDGDGFIEIKEMVSYLTELYETQPGTLEHMGRSAEDLAQEDVEKALGDDLNRDFKLSFEEATTGALDGLGA